MKNIKFLFLISSLVLFSVAAMAQPNGNGQGGGGTAPVDGGVSMLVAGIAAYGAKKIRDRRIKSSEEII
jgi:hypothetical protein